MNVEDVRNEINEVKNTLSQLVKAIEIQAMKRTHVKTSEACYYLSCSKNTLIKICGHYGKQPMKVLGENYYAIADLEQVFIKHAN
jgi:hypothetical protein